MRNLQTTNPVSRNKKKTTFKQFIKLSLLLIALPASSWAADFTFQVPVKLSHMHPNIAQGRVRCVVSTVRGRYAANPQVGEGTSQPFNLRGGAYNGTITVTVNATNERLRADAKSWGCKLSLKTADAISHRMPGNNNGFVGTGLAGEGPRPVYPRNRSAPYRNFDNGNL